MTAKAHTLFISDLHLQSAEPKTLQLLLNFLQQQAPQADALYILGDLFEAWIGDDDDQPLAQTVKKALQTLANQGVPTYLMPGNRDFLLGKRFAVASGCQLLSDPTRVELYNHLVLLTHGDYLCTDDKLHQCFRAISQQAWLRRLTLVIPLSLRRWVAQGVRRLSQRRTQRLTEQVMDVTPAAVQQAMMQYQVSRLIHGHTHQPAIHHWQQGQQDFMRIVLGAWHEAGSVLIYYADGRTQLASITLDGVVV